MKTRPTRLTTKRLCLREPRFSDWPWIHEYASDPRFVRYVVWGPNTESQTKAFLKNCLLQQKKKPRSRYDWVIEEKTSGKVVGMCGFTVVSTKDREGGAMGYGVNRTVWGRGYTTEAAKAMIHFGFQKLGLRRITSTCDVKNKASARVMEKAGMKREGLFRKNVFQKGKWRDTFFYAILKHKR